MRPQKPHGEPVPVCLPLFTFKIPQKHGSHKDNHLTTIYLAQKFQQ